MAMKVLLQILNAASEIILSWECERMVTRDIWKQKKKKERKLKKESKTFNLNAIDME